MLTEKQEHLIKSKKKSASKTPPRVAADKPGIKHRKIRGVSLRSRNKAVSVSSIRKFTSPVGSSNVVAREGAESLRMVVSSKGREEAIKSPLKTFGADSAAWLKRERTMFSQLIDYSGLPTDMELVKLVHNRLQVTVIDRLLAAGVTKQEIGLIAPPRTLAHRRANDERLTVEESERAVRLARAVAQTDVVFGNLDKAMGWLRRPLKRFEGRTPIEMLATDVGSRLVEEALVQIDEGFFA